MTDQADDAPKKDLLTRKRVLFLFLVLNGFMLLLLLGMTCGFTPAIHAAIEEAMRGEPLPVVTVLAMRIRFIVLIVATIGTTLVALLGLIRGRFATYLIAIAGIVVAMLQALMLAIVGLGYLLPWVKLTEITGA